MWISRIIILDRSFIYRYFSDDMSLKQFVDSKKSSNNLKTIIILITIIVI